MALDHGLGDWTGRRLALVQPHLESAPKILAGDIGIEARTTGLEPHGAHILVPIAVATGVALGLRQRSQPHGPHPRTRTGRIALPHMAVAAKTLEYAVELDEGGRLTVPGGGQFVTP